MTVNLHCLNPECGIACLRCLSLSLHNERVLKRDLLVFFFSLRAKQPHGSALLYGSTPLK